MRVLLTALITLFTISFSNAQDSVIGKWKSIDDETGEAKSIVEIYKKGDKVYGKILEIINPEDKDGVCDECEDSDPRKGEKIEGMEILTDMEKDGKYWEDGEILDPENGKVYRCKIWVEDGNLQVRGYIAFFFRTQEWLPVKE